MAIYLLIRHGACDPVGKFIAGRQGGIHLNDEGRKEIANLASRIESLPVSAIFSSPMERACETAEAIAEVKGLRIVVREELNEIDYGSWTGLSFEKLSEDPLWKLFNTFRGGTRIPGGEMMVEVASRMSRFMEENRRAGDGTNVIVSHGDPIKMAIAHYGGIPLELALRFNINTASVSVLSLDDYGARILCVNHIGAKIGANYL